MQISRAQKPPIKFGLGATIRYTQRAAVVRLHTQGGNRWGIHEGYDQRHIDTDVLGALEKHDPGDWINKDVLTWDESGVGTVIGLVKRGVGRSEPGYWTAEDYTGGWFEPHDWRWLYAVRHRLEGTDYILVPVENAELPG